jgi:type III restriction enzyme
VGKGQARQFKDREGKWNVCRFFFSKWTLCEGWDNPNVFVIAKLRSSGSEIRKLQEVGRGLRLPFDETGTRITPERYGEDFRLTYIIDYAEREFAKKLVGEINADGGSLAGGKISAALLEALVKAGYAEDPDGAFFRLGGEKIVDKDKNILDTARLFALLPGGSGFRLKQGVITGGGMPERPKVRLNLDNFRKIKDLWDRVTKRYLIKFETIEKDSLEKTLLAVFSGDDVFVKPSAVIINEYLSGNPARGDDERLVVKTEYTPAGTGLGILGYGEFLKRLNRRTALPLALIHKTIAAARRGKKTPPELFNVVTIEKIIRGFETAFVRIYRQKFSYQSLDYTARTSLWVDGDFVGELSQGCLGEHPAGDVVYDKERYLYDKVVYDSELEHEVLKVKPPARVIVYGKLPRKSIRLPTYTGGTTSPDFVYTIQGERPEEISLHLVVETKSDNPRLSDTVAVEAQEKALACTE